MAHAARIVTSAGVTLVTLISADRCFIAYAPDDEPGGGPVVTESAVWMFDESTVATMQDVVTALHLVKERIISRREHGAGDRIYLEVQWDTVDSGYWRSELFDLDVGLPESILDVDWAISLMEPTLTWTRENGWDGPEVEVQLSNAASAAATGGRVVYNPVVYLRGTTISFDGPSKEIRDSANGMDRFKTGDTIVVRGSAANNTTFTVVTGNVAAKVVVSESVTTGAAGPEVTITGPASNYVEIAAAQVEGDLPAKVRLELLNSGDADVDTIWAALNSRATSAPQLIEESPGTAPGGDVTTTLTNSSDASGGQYAALSWGTSDEETLRTWTLTNAQLDACKGFAYALFARLINPPDTSLSLRLALKDGAIELEEGQLVAMDGARIVLLWETQLPPANEGLTTMEPLSLVLSGQDTDNAGALDLDSLHLLPLEQGIRIYQPKTGAHLQPNETLIDDAITQNLYVLTTTPGKAARFDAEWAPPLMLQPNLTQRLFFLWRSSVDSEEVSALPDSLTVRAYIQPRRRTI